MREILGNAKTIRELLKGKYSIDYFQREFRWQEKHIRELIDDLTGKFLEDYQPGHTRERVSDYGHYFLGSIVVSRKDNSNNIIIDGQQRLTSLTLLLIYLRNLQEDKSDPPIGDLIVSYQFGKKSFNLHIEERISCMEALYNQNPVQENGQSESIQNIMARYRDIEAYFPKELSDDALPYFIDWLIENVHFVEITAYSDDDAYVIFETMNDRGLSLTPTEMLKGFLLANITDISKKNDANSLWRRRIQECSVIGKDVDSDSIKVWLRSQYANKIRERKKAAILEDFDLIGAEFHRWVRNNRENLGLDDGDDFYSFIKKDFDFYSRQYLKLIDASQRLIPGLEHVLYNADQGFSFQYLLLLSPLRPDDSPDVIQLKLRLVARFVDILLTRRVWNFRSNAYSNMQYATFVYMRDIRGLEPTELAEKLLKVLNNQDERISNAHRLYLNVWSRKPIHRILARITDYVEQQSEMPSRYMDYVSDAGKNRYEVEHIWANKPERHQDEFLHPSDFEDYRNRIGGLLLLPKTFNVSYGALSYEEKLPHYYAQNLLARSLNSKCYEHNPEYLKFIERSGLPFRPHDHFKKADLDMRGALYCEIAECIWNPNELIAELNRHES
jgi:uncharacterized protein with ParB-like and HNH nuclease domain